MHVINAFHTRQNEVCNWSPSNGRSLLMLLRFRSPSSYCLGNQYPPWQTGKVDGSAAKCYLFRSQWTNDPSKQNMRKISPGLSIQKGWDVLPSFQHRWVPCSRTSVASSLFQVVSFQAVSQLRSESQRCGSHGSSDSTKWMAFPRFSSVFIKGSLH